MVSRSSTLSSLLYRSFPTELSPSYFPRFPFRPPCPRFHLASSPRILLAPCRRFHPFPPNRRLPKLFPTVSLPSTRSSLPYRSFPTELSRSYFPRFPVRPPPRRFHLAPALPKLFPTISPPSTLSSLPARSFPTELSPSIPKLFPTFPRRPPSRRFHPFPPNRPLPKLFPTVSPPSTLSSLPYRSLAASATKREPKHRRCFWEKTYKWQPKQKLETIIGNEGRLKLLSLLDLALYLKSWVPPTSVEEASPLYLEIGFAPEDP